MPGMLAPGDIDRMYEATQKKFGAIKETKLVWAERVLLASAGGVVARRDTGKKMRVPTLVPARDATTGHCIFFNRLNERCTIHEVAPFGCAFFDAKMKNKEWQERSVAYHNHMISNVWMNPDAEYRMIWEHLDALGLRSPSIESSRLKISAEYAKTQPKKYKRRKRKSR